MSKINLVAQRLLSICSQLLPHRILTILEKTCQNAQGKGWGSGTVVEEAQAAMSLLKPSSRQHPVVLDIGANHGSWTAAILATTGSATVYSFEPSELASSVLAERFDGDSRVHVVKCAVGNEVGTATLWADRPGSGLASFSRRRLDHFEIDFRHSEEVPVVTLDSWHAENPVYPVLLKLDVEGHELAVLGGSTRTLESVEVVQFEFGGCNIDSRTYFQDFYYFFQKAGFRIFRLGPKGLRPIQRYSELDEVFSTTNYFAQRI